MIHGQHVSLPTEESNQRQVNSLQQQVTLFKHSLTAVIVH